jgi:hypothetical protein
MVLLPKPPDWLSIGRQAHPEGKYIINDSLIE